jgi:hypothetical protein
VRIIPHHLDGGGDISCVDISQHPSMEGRGQMVVVATEKVVVERKRGVGTRVVVATTRVVGKREWLW